MRQPGCQVGSAMSRRNLSKDEKGHLKRKETVKGWWGQIQANSCFPWRIKKSPSLLSLPFLGFWQGVKEILQLFISWIYKQGESRLTEQHQTIRAISLGLADPLELILARL